MVLDEVDLMDIGGGAAGAGGANNPMDLLASGSST
jgi:hypothetical protein